MHYLYDREQLAKGCKHIYELETTGLTTSKAKALARMSANHIIKAFEEPKTESEVDDLVRLIGATDYDTLYRVFKFMWTYGFTTMRAYRLIKAELNKRDAYIAQ